MSVFGEVEGEGFLIGDATGSVKWVAVFAASFRGAWIEEDCKRYEELEKVDSIT